MMKRLPRRRVVSWKEWGSRYVFLLFLDSCIPIRRIHEEKTKGMQENDCQTDSKKPMLREIQRQLNASWKICSLAVNGLLFLVIEGYLLNSSFSGTLWKGPRKRMKDNEETNFPVHHQSNTGSSPLSSHEIDGVRKEKERLTAVSFILLSG